MMNYKATLLALLAVSVTSQAANCPKGQKDCFRCGDSPTLATGQLTGFCAAGGPGGIGADPKTCLKWDIPAGFCVDINNGGCDDDFLCCAEGDTGYFFCNQEPAPGPPIDCVESRCERACCPWLPFVATAPLDCDGDGIIDQTYGKYGCWI